MHCESALDFRYINHSHQGPNTFCSRSRPSAKCADFGPRHIHNAKHLLLNVGEAGIVAVQEGLDLFHGLRHYRCMSDLYRTTRVRTSAAVRASLAMAEEGRVLVIAVDDSDGSSKAFDWAIQQLYKEGDQLHLVHVIPRLQFAAVYGVPPVDFVPVADTTTYEAAIHQAEEFIISRFVRKLAPELKCTPVVHIVKVYCQ